MKNLDSLKKTPLETQISFEMAKQLFSEGHMIRVLYDELNEEGEKTYFGLSLDMGDTIEDLDSSAEYQYWDNE